MSNPTVHNVRDIPAYEGPHAIPGIHFRAARAALGVESWGMNVLELAAGCTGHPEHTHAHDGQEEVYVVISRFVQLHVDGTAVELAAGDMVRVGPQSTRKLVTMASAATILALGGTPGAAFDVTPGM